MKLADIFLVAVLTDPINLVCLRVEELITKIAALEADESSIEVS